MSNMLSMLIDRVIRAGCPGRKGFQAGKLWPTSRLAVEQLEDRCLPSTLQAISLPPANQPPSDTAAGASSKPSVSDDGRYVTFESSSSNLVPGQSGGGGSNIFLLDRSTGTMTLVSHVPGNATATPTSQYGSFSPNISRNGRYVVYTSGAVEIVGHNPNGPTNQFGAVVYDRTTGQNTLISHSTTSPTQLEDGYAVAVSNDGRYTVFESTDVDLVPNQVTTPLPGGGPGSLSEQLFVYDQTIQTTLLVSHAFGQVNVTANGQIFLTDAYLTASIADDGTIAYVSQATDLDGFTTTQPQNVYLYSPSVFVSQATDLISGQTPSSFTNVFLYQNDGSDAVSLVSGVHGSPTVTVNGNSDSPAINGDGSYVAYRSDATNLSSSQVFGSNVYEFNVQADTQTLVSAQAGSPTNSAGGASEPVIDDDGHLISYVSTASNLIPGQNGPAGFKNVFIWLRQTGANILASGQNGSPTLTGNADSDGPLLTRHSFPGFSSAATNLLPGVGGTSVAYINTLVQLVLSPNSIYDGSPLGTVVGTVNVSTLLAGQYLPPVYTLPAAEANNALFALGADAGVGSPLITQFQANAAAESTYQVSVHVDIGFGDNSGILPVFVVASPSIQNQRYVAKVYQDLLLRAAEPDGLTFWTGLLDRGVPRAAVAQSLSHSAEYYSTNIVEPTYLKFLNRPADQVGLDFWVGELTQGVTDEQFLASFVSTPEYFQSNGGANMPYVDALYRDLLGRTPDAGGESYWTSQLDGGAERFSVALGFANSIEEATIRVQNVYQRFLGRPADASGLDFWVNGFAHGSTDEDIISGFIGSDEYFTHV